MKWIQIIDAILIQTGDVHSRSHTCTLYSSQLKLERCCNSWKIFLTNVFTELLRILGPILVFNYSFTFVAEITIPPHNWYQPNKHHHVKARTFLHFSWVLFACNINIIQLQHFKTQNISSKGKGFSSSISIQQYMI